MTDAQGHSIEIPMASVTKDVTVNVNLTGFRQWHMRLRIGLVLMRLAIWISGMGCKVEEPGETSASD